MSSDIDVCRDFMDNMDRSERAKPAEPVIEVAPGEPTPKQVEKHIFQKWSGVFERLAEGPAVPAQEAPPCSDCGQPFEAHRKFLSSDTKSYCHIPDTRHWYVPAEPQAGAQVPSQDEPRERLSFSKALEQAVEQMGKDARQIMDLKAHLNTIRNYAEESAKTPITREDMHDPLKAQTFYDETFGWIRLVLSEIGGPK